MNTTTAAEAQVGKRYATQKGLEVEYAGADGPWHRLLNPATGREHQVPGTYRLRVVAESQGIDVATIASKPPEVLRPQLPQLTYDQLDDLIALDSRAWVVQAVADELGRRGEGDALDRVVAAETQHEADAPCPVCGLETSRRQTAKGVVFGSHTSATGSDVLCLGTAKTLTEAAAYAEAHAPGIRAMTSVFDRPLEGMAGYEEATARLGFAAIGVSTLKLAAIRLRVERCDYGPMLEVALLTEEAGKARAPVLEVIRERLRDLARPPCPLDGATVRARAEQVRSIPTTEEVGRLLADPWEWAFTVREELDEQLTALAEAARWAVALADEAIGHEERAWAADHILKTLHDEEARPGVRTALATLETRAQACQRRHAVEVAAEALEGTVTGDPGQTPIEPVKPAQVEPPAPVRPDDLDWTGEITGGVRSARAALRHVTPADADALLVAYRAEEAGKARATILKRVERTLAKLGHPLVQQEAAEEEAEAPTPPASTPEEADALEQPLSDAVAELQAPDEVEAERLARRLAELDRAPVDKLRAAVRSSYPEIRERATALLADRLAEEAAAASREEVQLNALALHRGPDGRELVYRTDRTPPELLGPADDPRLREAARVIRARALAAKPAAPPAPAASPLGALGEALAALQAMGLKVQITITSDDGGAA